MKLPTAKIRFLLLAGGKFKQITVMGEVLTEGLSDRGSTPLRSTRINVCSNNGGKSGEHKY